MARGDRKRTLNVLDLFSGIGGFALGVENAGIQHEWLGFSEIDKYATELYKRRFPNAKEFGSVENVSYKKLKGKRLDLLTGGFPCQAFSIAGNRRGFEDTRGTMFFEIARILRDYIENGKPIPCILLENVKGLLSHDNRRTFTTIYKILTDLNYTIECQLVNTKWWLPQNRERIFIFGRYNGNPSGRKVFPVYGSSEKASKLQGQHTNTITARYEAGATGSYVVESELNAQKEIDIVGNLKGKGGHECHNVYSPDGIAPTVRENHGKTTKVKLKKGELNQICNVGGKDNQANRVYDINGISKTLTDGGGGGAKTGLYRVHSTQTRNPNRPSLTRKCDCGSKKLYQKCCGAGGGSGHLSRDDGNTYCLDSGNTQAVESKSRIRKLTPIECERLQGFPDNWTEGQSDTQRYKQCGNAVSVPVIKSIIEKIYDL